MSNFLVNLSYDLSYDLPYDVSYDVSDDLSDDLFYCFDLIGLGGLCTNYGVKILSEGVLMELY